MNDASNDRTIGRTNVAPGGAASHPSSGIPAQPPSSAPPATHVRSASTRISAGGTFEWPTNANHYRLINRVGQGAFASVWRARIVDSSEGEDEADEGVQCAIKIMDLEHVNINISDIRLEVQTMRLSSHPNVLVCHTSFIKDTHLWLVTQLMSKGSSLHCLQRARAKILADASLNPPSGDTQYAEANARNFTHKSDDSVLEGGLTAYAYLVDPVQLVFETHVTYILYETLLGLKYIHDNGQIHRDVKAGNLLLDEQANVRIADFGVSSWLIDGGNKREHTTTFVGTPCWMAPEVMEQVDGYDYKADIWSLGITALELCKGYAPYAKYAPMKVLLRTIQEDPPSLETYNDGDDPNMWSKSFRSMVKLCLQKDPTKRPTCAELLAHKHFKPLSSDEGREQWRLKTKQQVCDVVQDVGKLSGNVSSRENLPGAIPVQIVASLTKDRPAGTSWILPGGSSVDVSSAKNQGQANDENDFFDQFEQQTGGENFVRDDAAATQKRGNNSVTPKKEGEEDEDDINDFFDEFEKTTRGENFKRGDN